MEIFGQVVCRLFPSHRCSSNVELLGTITNGNDMIAAFLKQLYPGPLSTTVCAIADVGDRGQDFPKIEGESHM
jgi:hypothetical protein